MKKIKAFTLAEVPMAKRTSGKECLHSISRVSEPKEPSNNRRKLAAFTLAEVLITLAIIGVVAALTIPTVITNYKAKALETQRKKAMSVLSNGYRLLMANDDVTLLQNTKLASCGNDKSCYTNEIKRVFNVVSDNNTSNDIFSTTYQFTSETKPVWTDNRLKYVFITSDGMIFGISPEETGGLFIAADINGIKNPNKGGQDLCKFNISNTGGITDHCAEMSDWEEDTPDCSSYNNRQDCVSANCWWFGHRQRCQAEQPVNSDCSRGDLGCNTSNHYCTCRI